MISFFISPVRFLSDRIRRWRRGPLPFSPQRYAIGHACPQGMIDSVQVEPAGVIRVEGWSSQSRIPDASLPHCTWNGTPIPLSQRYRTWRPDVPQGTDEGHRFQGFECLYILPDAATYSGRATLVVTCTEAAPFTLTLDAAMSIPHYRHLLATTEVGHREHIYGVGPPPATVTPEILELAISLPVPILDFGCGSGALVKALRAQGREASGLELKTNPFLAAMAPEARPYVTLYDGTIPLPFADSQFQSVISVEVLEHIANYEAVVRELARVAAKQVILTVPDISAIPLGFHHGVIPWHLMESTHVNFFTQPALEQLLRKYFPDVRCIRIGPTQVNGTRWFGSLVAVCTKSSTGHGAC